LLADRQHVHAKQSELYEQTIADLRQELDAAKIQLKESKEKVAEPSSLLLHLQQELLSVKVAAAEFYLFILSVCIVIDSFDMCEKLFLKLL